LKRGITTAIDAHRTPYKEPHENLSVKLINVERESTAIDELSIDKRSNMAFVKDNEPSIKVEDPPYFMKAPYLINPEFGKIEI
jgi:hypothetical protein